MLLDILVRTPWLVALCWGALSVFDFLATMWYSKAYREFMKSYITYEGGMEMNPAFEKDVSELRWISPRYLFSMLAVAFLLVLGGAWLPLVWFEVVAGAALLLVLVTDFRHIENLSVVRALRKDPEGLRGRIEQSYALSQRRVAIGVLNTGVLFLIVYLLTQRIFFVGGAVVCGFYALRHYRLATRKLPGPTSVE